MRDNTFTPGPWSVEDGNTTGKKVVADKSTKAKKNISHCGGPDRDSNARLIAAAPDMYDALWETIELSDRNLTEAGRTPECQRVYDIVRAALAKAEGDV